MHWIPKRKTGLLMSVLIALILLPMVSLAQEGSMADTLRSEGKIYVVVMIITTIFVGIILTLVYLDNKIKKLEKQNKLK